jgi:nicotinic acetylcholine receptor
VTHAVCSADESIDSKFATNVVIYHTGIVHWVPLGIYISSCAVNIRWFPFDEQTCRLKFGSWTYDSTKINLTLRSDVIDISTYVDNGEWAWKVCHSLLILLMIIHSNVVLYEL